MRLGALKTLAHFSSQTEWTTLSYEGVEVVHTKNASRCAAHFGTGCIENGLNHVESWSFEVGHINLRYAPSYISFPIESISLCAEKLSAEVDPSPHTPAQTLTYHLLAPSHVECKLQDPSPTLLPLEHWIIPKNIGDDACRKKEVKQSSAVASKREGKPSLQLFFFCVRSIPRWNVGREGMASKKTAWSNQKRRHIAVKMLLSTSEEATRESPSPLQRPCVLHR